MSDVMVMDGFGEFDGLLRSVLRERVSAAAPKGMEQRLLARLAQQDEVVAQPFSFAERVRTPRSAASTWIAVGAHAAVLAMLLAVASVRVMTQRSVGKTMASVELVSPPPMPPKTALSGGGGGQPDKAPVTVGHLPKFSQTQLLAPKAPPTIAPKLAVEPTVVVQQDLKMADNKMPDMGSPASSLKGFSLGNGTGGGVGSGNGNGMGPGSGGNEGGSIMQVGGGVSAPKVIFQVDPEFSEEARKAKFSGNVDVSVIVDEQGRPTHVHVARGIGMGLDEKAIEAVKQYKFKPAMLNGKPVKVAVDVDVVFQIF
jgi:protein TonB